MKIECTVEELDELISYFCPPRHGEAVIKTTLVGGGPEFERIPIPNAVQPSITYDYGVHGTIRKDTGEVKWSDEEPGRAL